MAANKPTSLQRIIIILVVHTATFNLAIGQTNYLSQKISISFSNITIARALEEITRISKVKFSYNTNIIDRNKIVSVHAEQACISEILDVITEEKLRYKVVGQHIILLSKEKPIYDKKEVQFYTLSGWVIDSRTNRKLENVSVYSVGDRNSAITDKKGFYSIILPISNQTATINYSKKNYFDTIVFCSSQKDQEINLILSPKILPMPPIAPVDASIAPIQISDLKLVQNFVPKEAIINSENLKIFENRPAQISFLPYLGSNAKLSGTKINNASLNVIAGFSGAVNGIEIGSVLNITKRHVNGVQISGFGNITGEYSRGTQIAGFLNRTMGTMAGVQISGFANIVKDTVNGVQIAGFLNKTEKKVTGIQVAGFTNVINNTIKGIQISGFLNKTKAEVTGVQIAGFNNILHGKMGGVQIAGFNNYTTQNVDGVQIAGFLNIAHKDVKALQVSGAINYTKGTNKGGQLAGLLNIADTVKGFQLAVVNISDTSSGISLGLFNYVKKGYRTFSISANEVLPVNLTYKTGTYKLYNIFTAGINPWGIYPRGAGTGLGTLINYNKKLSVALELTSNQIIEEKNWQEELNLLNKLGVTFNYKITDHLEINAGPVFNVHVSSVKDEDTGEFKSSIAMNPIYENISGSTSEQIWVGGSIGINLQFFHK